MGGVLEGLNDFATGATGGFEQGLGFVDRVQQTQRGMKQRQAEAEIQDEIARRAQNGELDDPIEGSKGIGELYLQHGMMDQYKEYAAYAKELTDAKIHTAALTMSQMAEIDPQGAIAQAQQIADLTGSGAKFAYGMAPGGGSRVSYDGPEGSNFKEYANNQELAADLMEWGLGWLEDPTKKRQTDAEVRKAEAAARSSEASAKSTEMLIPSQIAENVAQTGSANAAAANAMSAADERRQMLPGALDLQKAQTEAAGRSQGGMDDEDAAMLDAAGAGKPDPNAAIGTYNPTDDKVPLYTISKSIEAANPDSTASERAALTLQIVGTTEKVLTNPATGEVSLNGMIYNVGRPGVQTIEQILQRKKGVAK